MYVLLLIVILLVVLFVMKSNIEPFTNKQHVFSQVRKIDFKKDNKKKEPVYGDDINVCENKNHNFQDFDFSYRSKYDSTHCISCKNQPKCAEHNDKCINEQTGYNVQDNCVEDGICRINEDVINMFPIKTCLDKNNKNNKNI